MYPDKLPPAPASTYRINQSGVSMTVTDFITGTGALLLLAGLYLWLGLAALLIATGLILILVGVRLAQLEQPEDEPNEDTTS